MIGRAWSMSWSSSIRNRTPPSALGIDEKRPFRRVAGKFVRIFDFGVVQGQQQAQSLLPGKDFEKSPGLGQLTDFDLQLEDQGIDLANPARAPR